MTQNVRQHKVVRRSGLLLGLLGLAGVLAWGVTSPVEAASACGPGPHWVDTCPTGLDFFPLTTGQHTIEIFGFGNVTLSTVGPATVWRGAGTTTPDHHIDTELVSLTLMGGGLTLQAGDGVANGICDGPLCSLGRITEQANPFFADSFFDVFFEITGTPFGPLRNSVPCQMESVIDRIPPEDGTTYVCTSLPVLLSDGSGVARAQLLDATHTVYNTPEPGTVALFGSGLVGVIALGIRRRRAQKG